MNALQRVSAPHSGRSGGTISWEGASSTARMVRAGEHLLLHGCHIFGG